MELKDQILQTKERKKGFLKAMPEDTRKQINAYTKLDKIAKNYWFIIIGALIVSGAVYLVSCFVANENNKYAVLAILAALWVVAGIVLAFWVKSLAAKAKKAIGLGAPDYVEELNAINTRLAGLERAEKQRLAAEKEEARAKAQAEAAQRKAEEALQKQQAVMQATGQQPAAQPPKPPVTNPEQMPPQE
jgi:glucan phosphoethanolaminetransferase (alkaline phosphatase superfamily)